MRRIKLMFLILVWLLTCSGHADTVSFRPSESEGYTFSYQGCNAVVHRIQSGKNSLHGVFYLPQNFDQTKQYPVMIFSHGFNSSSYADTDYLPYLTQWGILCYKFDFAGGAVRSRSEGDFLQMSLMTEKADLLHVINDVLSQPFVDPTRVALIGMSQGGAVTGLTAPEVSNLILGEILVYPAFNLLDEVHAQYAAPEELPDQLLLLNQYVGKQYFADVWGTNLASEAARYEGPVLLIHGTGDRIVDYQHSAEAVELFRNARLITLKDAPHGFGKKEITELAPDLQAFLIEIGLIPGE